MNIEKLHEHPKSTAISIYLPTHKRWEETQEDRIKLKKVLRKIEKFIPKEKKLLEPLNKLLDDDEFWKYQKEGLAIFSAEGVFEVIKTEEPLPDQFYVDNEFILSPLPGYLFKPIEYYLLTISQNNVNLLEIKNGVSKKINSTILPKNLKEALWVDDDPQVSIQHKSSKKTGRGTSGAMVFHGHGANVDPYKENLSRFFNEIDEKINKIIKEKDKPLVLACVEYQYPIYKKTNKYPKLSEEFIPGNPERMNEKDLIQKGNVIAAFEHSKFS